MPRINSQLRDFSVDAVAVLAECALQSGFEKSLRRLDMERVDLYLIHWPKPAQDRYVDTWRAFEKLYADGRARAIGVSNFQVAHLQRLLDETDVVPAVNQVELHLDLQQGPLRRFLLFFNCTSRS